MRRRASACTAKTRPRSTQHGRDRIPRRFGAPAQPTRRRAAKRTISRSDLARDAGLEPPAVDAREHEVKRFRYPEISAVGIRASQPNQYWHLDVTVIRLLDRTRLYLHAVIDNDSRKILAWRLMPRLEPATTCELLVEAGAQLPPLEPASSDTACEPVTVVMDTGVENVNRAVDALIDTRALRRVLAQVEVAYSNSMIEAWWRSLRHRWLYLHDLATEADVRRLVAFYVTEHNTVMPHYAFDGRTPNEAYLGHASDLPAELARRRAEAQRDRLLANRATRCGACEPAEPTAPGLPLA